jgi:uncharacterized membrane protein YraQ (UPF0718 family)
MNIGNYYLIVAIVLLFISFIKDKERTKKALKSVLKISLNVLPVLFFIFVIMGIISIFVSRETIASLLGSKSGIIGILLGEIIGAVALIQPAAVYPFSGTLLNKGASYAVIYAFIGTAILIGVATLPAEIKFLGKRFTLVRNLLTFIVIFIFSILIHFIM